VDKRNSGGLEAEAPQYEAPRAKRRGSVRANVLTPYLFMVPYLILFAVFVLIPAFFGIWMSLHQWDYFAPVKEWVGLENFAELFTPGTITYELFWKSMGATGKFTLFSVPLLVVIPLIVALILNQKFRGQSFFRAMYFAPYVLGVAVIGILWRFLLDRNVGYVNYYLGTA
jgi:multiple sugar transport system permease protein